MVVAQALVTFSLVLSDNLESTTPTTNTSKRKDVPSNAPMVADVNLSSNDMRVESVLERFEKERFANIPGETSDEQFLVAGLDTSARGRETHDLSKLEQSMKDIHVVEIFSQPKTMATASRLGLTFGLVFDTSRSCQDLHVRTKTERLCKYLQN